jgi:hypothetical protein
VGTPQVAASHWGVWDSREVLAFPVPSGAAWLLDTGPLPLFRLRITPWGGSERFRPTALEL